MLTTSLISWNASSWLHWMLSVRLKHVECAICRRRSPLSAEVTMAKRRRLERRWIRSGRESDKEDFRRCCRDTNRLIQKSRRQLVSSRIGQCVNARQRWSAARKLLYDDNQSARTDDDVSFCNMFVNYFVFKIDSLNAAITSQPIDIALPPLDPVCSHPSMQLLEPVTSFEISKISSIFHRSLVVWTTFLLPSLYNAILFSLTSLLTWLTCPFVRALYRPSLSTLLSLHF